MRQIFKRLQMNIDLYFFNRENDLDLKQKPSPDSSHIKPFFMKRFMYLLSLLMVGTLLTFVACDKEGVIVEEDTDTWIVEEDLNGFDAQSEATYEAKYFSEEEIEAIREKDREIEEMYSGKETVVIGSPNSNSRSTSESVAFDMHNWWKSIQVRTTSGWQTMYSGYATNVVIGLPIFQTPDYCGTASGVDALQWRVISSGVTSLHGCAGFAVDYYVNGSPVDSDILNHDRGVYNYFRTMDGTYGSTTANETAISRNYYTCGYFYNICP